MKRFAMESLISGSAISVGRFPKGNEMERIEIHLRFGSAITEVFGLLVSTGLVSDESLFQSPGNWIAPYIKVRARQD